MKFELPEDAHQGSFLSVKEFHEFLNDKFDAKISIEIDADDNENTLFEKVCVQAKDICIIPFYDQHATGVFEAIVFKANQFDGFCNTKAELEAYRGGYDDGVASCEPDYDEGRERMINEGML